MGLFKKLKSTLGEYKDIYDNAKAEQEAKMEREEKFGDLFYGEVPENAEELSDLPFKVTEEKNPEFIAHALARVAPDAPETAGEVVYLDKGRWDEITVYYHGPFFRTRASKSLVFDLVADAPDLHGDYGEEWSSGTSDEEMGVAWNGKMIGVMYDEGGVFSEIERSGVHLQLKGWSHGVNQNGEVFVEIRQPDAYQVRQWLAVRRVSGDQLKFGQLEKMDYVELSDERWEELRLSNGQKVTVTVELVEPSDGSTAKPRVALAVNGTILSKRTNRWQFYDELTALVGKKMAGYACRDEDLGTRGRVCIKGTSSHEKIHC